MRQLNGNWVFGMNFDFINQSPFVSSANDNGSADIGNYFLLLDGNRFSLLDGTFLELL